MKKQLRLDINALNSEKEETPPFRIMSNGTLQSGELEIGQSGLLINGQSPSILNNSISPVSFDGENSPLPLFHSSLQNLTSNDAPMGLDLKDIKELDTLGTGSSAVVKKFLHIPTSKLLAVKIIKLTLDKNEQKQILLEIKTLHKTNCENVICFFDAFYEDGFIFTCLEYMDVGSLGTVLTKTKCIPEKILANITVQILKGLQYLHKQLHLVHRDIKPSNILVNQLGQIKISDFGVSSQLESSLSKCKTWVGTVLYMSPERILGNPYSYESDIWSLGISLLEVATGVFPYPQTNQLQNSQNAFWDIAEKIVKHPTPTLPTTSHSMSFCLFIDMCLRKEAQDRSSTTVLLFHAWIQQNVELDSQQQVVSLWLQQQNLITPPNL